MSTPALHVFTLFTQTEPGCKILPADVAVAEMSDSFCQPSLFYHLGVRESFSMTNNIILYCYKQDSDLQAIKVQPKHRANISLNVRLNLLCSCKCLKLCTSSVTSQNPLVLGNKCMSLSYSCAVLPMLE